MGSNLSLQHRSWPQRNDFEKTEKELLIIVLFNVMMHFLHVTHKKCIVTCSIKPLTISPTKSAQATCT